MILDQVTGSDKFTAQEKFALQYEANQEPLKVETRRMGMDDLKNVYAAVTHEEKAADP